MQHNDNGTRGGVVRLHRVERNARSQSRTASRHADEASGCKRLIEREAHRAPFNPDIEVTAESLVNLLPNPIITDLTVDQVCKQTLFLANLVGSPSVELS